MMSIDDIISEGLSSTELALQLQSDLRHLFARKARHLLDILESQSPDDKKGKKQTLSHYFLLHASIDAVDRDIERYVTEAREGLISEYIDRHYLDILLK